MRIALLQYPIEWADIEVNTNLAERRLSQVKGKADVAMLPEMFTTGFCTDNPRLAEEMSTSPTLARMQQWASDFQLAVYATVMIAENSNLYNRAFFVRPDGSFCYSDKRHLYAHGGEADFFTQGQQRVVAEYKGVRFLLLTCYDLRFPAWSRNTTGHDYDIILYTANWPDVRIRYWDALLPARVIENQCVVCGVNRVGDDALGLHYNGHSTVIDTRLNRLVKFADDEAATKIADIDVDEIRRFREHSPLWRDADRFEFIKDC